MLPSGAIRRAVLGSAAWKSRPAMRRVAFLFTAKGRAASACSSIRGGTEKRLGGKASPVEPCPSSRPLTTLGNMRETRLRSVALTCELCHHKGEGNRPNFGQFIGHPVVSVEKEQKMRTIIAAFSIAALLLSAGRPALAQPASSPTAGPDSATKEGRRAALQKKAASVLTHL